MGRTLVLKALTDIPGFDARIQDIVLNGYKACFEAVSLVEKGRSYSVQCWTESADGKPAPAWDLESLIQQTGQDVSLERLGVTTVLPPIPVIVRYKDSHQTTWESVNELRYDAFMGNGDIRHVCFKRIA
jgi:hypothetical protein